MALILLKLLTVIYLTNSIQLINKNTNRFCFKSSTFLITKEKDLTEANIKDLISYIEGFIFSKPLIKSGMSLDEINKVLKDHDFMISTKDSKIQNALKEGKIIYYLGGDDFNMTYNGIAY